MLRLSKTVLAGVAAAALITSSAALAQLSGRLDAQEQKLAQAENSCGEVNLAEYAQLLQEASKNKKRADKAAKAGAPVNPQVDADLAKAMMLFARAQAAQARNCMMQAQQQAQPQANSTPHPAQPVNAQSDFYANATPQVSEKRPELVQTGARFPAICSYETMTVALDRAKQGQNCPSPRTDAMNLSPFARDVLGAHNELRHNVGSPPLQWDPLLEQHALARSQELARIHELVHAPRQGRGTERENIAKAPASYSATQIMKLWSDEGKDFVPGVFPNVCGKGGECSWVWHFTQMIWGTTLRLGCGMTKDGAFVWFVCRYDPGGNKDGKPVVMAQRAPDAVPVVEQQANSTVRARAVGGDYGGGMGKGQTTEKRKYRDGQWYRGPDFGTANDSYDPFNVSGGERNPLVGSYLSYSSDAFGAQIAGLVEDNDSDLDWAIGGGATLSGSSDLELIVRSVLDSSVTGKLGYQGQFNSDVTDHAIYGNLTLSFDPNAVPDGRYVDTKVEPPKLRPAGGTFDHSAATADSDEAIERPVCETEGSCNIQSAEPRIEHANLDKEESWGSSDEALWRWDEDEKLLKQAAHDLLVAQANKDQAAIFAALDKGQAALTKSKHLLDRLHKPGHGGQMIGDDTIESWDRTVHAYEAYFKAAEPNADTSVEQPKLLPKGAFKPPEPAPLPDPM